MMKREFIRLDGAATDKRSSFHVLGLWSFDNGDGSDVLASALRQGREWSCRIQFRCYGPRPRECRYSYDCGRGSKADMSSWMKGLIGYLNVDRRPVRHLRIDGDMGMALNKLFQDYDFLGRTVNDPSVPLVHGKDGSKLAEYFLRNRSKRTAKARANLLKMFARYKGAVEPGVPNTIFFWIIRFLGKHTK